MTSSNNPGTISPSFPSTATTGDQSVQTTLDVLLGARKLIEKEENWCPGRDHVRRCALLAIADTADAINVSSFEAEATFREVIGSEGIAGWNDSRTHAEVLAVFDKAIELERGKDSLKSPVVTASSNEEGVVP
jgi:hypothetical protein